MRQRLRAGVHAQAEWNHFQLLRQGRQAHHRCRRHPTHQIIGIPPAYDSVWICPSSNGHIQATGLDARGRKQYRYHPKWRELRDQNKYEHIILFAAALPALRERVASDMKRDGLPREKVLATIVSLLEKTLIRVGNAEYAEKNKSYGLTTMRRKHVEVGRGILRFDFTGKSGKQWKLRVEDKRIAAIVKRSAEIPGHELFKYLDEDGQPHTVDSGDVNAYIQDITGEDFSAKDFRTWAGTVLAALALAEFKKYDSQAEGRRSATSSPRLRASRSSLATHRPSAASATCTRKS
ncbi:DNA topoisomerase IB [Bradyrhizobium sp. LB7.1]